MTSSRLAPNAGQNFLREPEWLAAFLLSAVIVGLHFYFFLHAGGFWRDEVNLIHLASGNSFAQLKQDSFPILMPLLVRGWSAVGLAGNDLAARSLGLLIGLGILAALWLAAWQARRRPPLLSLALFGFNSVLIVFGDSLRAYGLGCLLILLTAAAAVALTRRPSWARAGGLALLATLSAQTLYHNAPLVAAICAGAWAVSWRKKNGRLAAQIFLAGLVAALSLWPYVGGFMAGQDSFAVVRTGLKPWRLLAAFQDTLGFPLGKYIYLWALLAGGSILLAAAALRRSPKISDETGGSSDELNLFAGTTVLAAIAGYLLFLWLAAFPSQSWYLLPLLALMSVGFEISRPDWRGKARAIFLGSVLGTALVAVFPAWRDLQNRFTNVNVWAAQLKYSAGADDYVVIVPWFCGITFGHYFQGATAWSTLPPLADHATHRYDLVRRQIQNTNAIQPVLDHITATLQNGHRVWVLASLGWMSDFVPKTPAPASLPPAPLRESGWSEMPYTQVWTSQVAHTLGVHATQFTRVKNPTAGWPVIENMELFLAEGWKNP